jgi:hypothetical protein
VPVGVLRLLKSLFAQFMSSKMVLFAVSCSRGGVGMGRQVVKFRCFIV